MNRVVLVVAKAPVPGQVKTRLIGAVTARGAAEIAAAALLDTLETALAVPDSATVVALTGDIARGARAAELTESLAGCRVIPQRGRTFGERLRWAHRDAALHHETGCAVVQIAMDTPQLSVPALVHAFDRVEAGGAALGPTPDGGWWALGLADPRAADGLPRVPMSTATTFRDTLRMLISAGQRPALLPTLVDVDTWADALQMSRRIPRSRFAAAVRASRRIPETRAIPETVAALR